jgi:predicted RNA-binding protein with PUA-like domain
MPKYWLMKTEPETFSIDDLERVKVEPWTGVRSNFARFHMRNMSVGDPVLFYHSSCEPPGVAGLAKVTKTRVIDETQFDPESKYYDPKATRDKPIWDCVEVELVQRLPRFVSLAEIRAEPALSDMLLLKRGMRLSVQPIDERHYQRITAMADEPAPVLADSAPKKAPPAKKQSKTSKKKPAPKPKRSTRAAARAPKKPARGRAARTSKRAR